ncbi:MAG: glycosyltransferase family 39 protein, partial [Methanobacteriaceae archaeon]|nr:glycosyltransferase family 39 protein [Methanobacteriaceae archaeon]
MEKIKKCITNNKPSLMAFTLLAVITAIFTYALVTIQSQIGVYYWDIFLYLNNALKMAGMGVGDTLYLSPFLPFITSLFFRADFIYESTLFAISGVFYFLGTLGLYLLLKMRFNEWESLVGALSFATFTVVIIWAVSGALDVPAISLSIWALYLTLLAVKKDSKFFYLAFPVAMLAFLTRYTSGLILIPMLLVIYINRPQGHDLKKAIKGIILGVLIYLPFMFYFKRQVGNLFPFFQQFSGSASGAVSSANPGYSLDTLYYFKYIPEYISSQASSGYQNMLWPSYSSPTILAYVLIGILMVGILIYLFKIFKQLFKEFKTLKNGNESLSTEDESNNLKSFYFRLAAVIITGIILVGTYSQVSYAVSEVIMVIMSISIYLLLKNLDLKYLDLDILFLTWFLAFLIMHSAHPVKVDRYFITMAPPMAYGIALGINQISSLIKYKFKGINATSALISVLLVFSIIFSTVTYIDAIPHSDPQVESEQAAAQWLMNYDPDYKNKTIAADRGPAFSWYLKKYVFTRIPLKVTYEVFTHLIAEINPDYYL